MGRTLTNTGISFNFGGTSVPSAGLGLQFGENKEAFVEYNASGGGTIVIEALDKQVAINVDGGTLKVSLATTGVLELQMGNTSVLRGINSGTVFELNGLGNMLLAGTIGTNITF